MHCTTCGQPLANGAQFCIGCGSPATPATAATPAFCTGCGASLPQGGRFCPTCGRPSVPPTGGNAVSMRQQQWMGGAAVYAPQQHAGAWARATAYVSNRGWAQLVVCALVIVIIVDVVAIFSDLARLDLLSRVISGDYVTQSELQSSDNRQAVVGLIQFMLYLATAAFFLTWIFRAYKNLQAFNVRGLRFSPGWAVGGWFVPFLNLWRPHEVMREIWRASSPRAPVADERAWKGEPVSPLMGWWWAAWIIGGVIGWIAFRPFGDSDPDTLQVQTVFQLVSTGVQIVAGILAMLVVSQVTGRQEEKNRVLAAGATGGGLAPPALATPVWAGAESAEPASRPGVPLTANAVVIEPSVTRGYCGRCGQELGVNEKMMGLTAHEVCPMPVSEAPAPTPAPATGAVETGAAASIAPPPPDADVASPSVTRGYCGRCGQELGVNEKMMGLTAHEVCPMPVSEAPAPATAPATDAVETGASVPAVPPAPDAAEGSPSIRRGYCNVCGQELGVNEKMRGLTVHQRCPMPVAEAPAAAPEQASQVYCKDCGTPMPASSRFCHKCGSAAVATFEWPYRASPFPPAGGHDQARRETGDVL